MSNRSFRQITEGVSKGRQVKRSWRRRLDEPAPHHQALYEFGGVRVESSQHALIGPDGAVRLTRSEWQLLLCLIEAHGRVISREAILDQVWGSGYESEAHLLHDLISRLRRRFLAAGLSSDPIDTLHGVGYCLRFPTSEAEGRVRKRPDRET